MALGGKALKDPQGEAGEGVFALWPRTDEGGRILSLQVASRLREPYEGPQAVVQGVLLYADRERLVLLILPKGARASKWASSGPGASPPAWSPRRPTGWRGGWAAPTSWRKGPGPWASTSRPRRRASPSRPPSRAGRTPTWSPRREGPSGKRGEKRPSRQGAPQALPGPLGGKGHTGEGAGEAVPAPKGRKPLPRRDPVRVWRAPEEPPDPAPRTWGGPRPWARGS